MPRLKDHDAIRRIAKKSLFEGLDALCEGAIIVDREARIVWISDKYAARLNLESAAAAEGRVVEDVIPNSLLREVVRTGEPMLLDIMQFGEESFVVLRMPLKDERRRVIGRRGSCSSTSSPRCSRSCASSTSRARAREHAPQPSPRSAA